MLRTFAYTVNKAAQWGRHQGCIVSHHTIDWWTCDTHTHTLRNTLWTKLCVQDDDGDVEEEEEEDPEEEEGLSGVPPEEDPEEEPEDQFLGYIHDDSLDSDDSAYDMVHRYILVSDTWSATWCRGLLWSCLMFFETVLMSDLSDTLMICNNVNALNKYGFKHFFREQWVESGLRTMSRDWIYEHKKTFLKLRLPKPMVRAHAEQMSSLLQWTLPYGITTWTHDSEDNLADLDGGRDLSTFRVMRCIIRMSE